MSETSTRNVSSAVNQRIVGRESCGKSKNKIFNQTRENKRVFCAKSLNAIVAGSSSTKTNAWLRKKFGWTSQNNLAKKLFIGWLKLFYGKTKQNCKAEKAVPVASIMLSMCFAEWHNQHLFKSNLFSSFATSANCWQKCPNSSELLKKTSTSMIPFSRDISVDNKVSGCPQCSQLRKQSYQLYPFFGVSERRCLVFL